MPAWYLPRTAQCYVKEEATYATAPSLAATDAVRHQPGSVISFNPRNLAPSPERKTHPSQVALFTRRQTGQGVLKAMMYPSGLLNTLPELDKLILNALGAQTNITLSTTFSGSPTTTSGTVASATGLAANQPIQINIAAGGNAGTYIRWLTPGYAGGTSLTWTPALPAAPQSGDTCKGTVGYSLATALPKSLDFAHYPQAPAASTPARELLGWVLDEVVLTLDSNLEPMISFSGPAQGLAGSSPNFSPQAQPGGFTTVGAESGIPSGLTGYFQLGATAYQIEKLEITIKNGMIVQNTALGTSKAVAYLRSGKRQVTFKISAKVSDDLTLWTPSLASSSNAIYCQVGTTSSRMWGIHMPFAVITDNPDVPDGSDDVQNWDFQGQALGNVGNDEFYLAAA